MGWTYGAPDNTPTDGPRITAVTTAFTSIALILVCLRWYVRTTVVKAVGKGEFTQTAICGTRGARSTDAQANQMTGLLSYLGYAQHRTLSRCHVKLTFWITAWSMRLHCLQCNSYVTVGNTVLPLKLTETETKWGLGIHVIEDMPTENILHFGRVSTCVP